MVSSLFFRKSLRTDNEESDEEQMTSRIYIRKVRSSDKQALIAMAHSSQHLHHPWITPPQTANMFRLYLRRTQREDAEGFVCCLRQTDEIVGVVNLNDIVYGSFLSANLSYYVDANHQGHGYMTEALSLVARFSFEVLGLHRLEAAIQPGNQPSKKLVQRCGFSFEGLAHDFLFIDGQWRDHERWALVDLRSSLTRP